MRYWALWVGGWVGGFTYRSLQQPDSRLGDTRRTVGKQHERVGGWVGFTYRSLQQLDNHLGDTRHTAGKQRARGQFESSGHRTG